MHGYVNMRRVCEEAWAEIEAEDAAKAKKAVVQAKAAPQKPKPGAKKA